MRIGVSLPQTAIGAEPAVIRDFAQAAEGIGFQHLATYDHVLGANLASRPDWKFPYSSANPFHDPFVLFGYLAAHTTRIEFSTHVLILPQRQATLVAKQAASVDVFSGGRLRLGIGIGWNELEYVGLGENFKNRGVRSEEQVVVMKRLWTEQHVRFKGTWHEIPDAGLTPMPIQRPIPVWFGGHKDQVLERIARVGDGWILLAHRPDDRAAAAIAQLRDLTRKAGRPESAVGVDAWTSMGKTTPEQWRAEVTAWRALGVSHITLNTTFARAHHVPIDGTGLATHVAAMRAYYEAVRDLA